MITEHPPTREVSALSRSVTWNNRLFGAGGHFLQSTMWQDVQSRLGYEVCLVEGKCWYGMASILRRKMSSYAYFPYGPQVDANTDMAMVCAQLQSWAKDAELTFCRIEPYGIIVDNGHSKDLVATRMIQPKFTWQLSLNQSIEEMKAAMRSRLRGYINSAAKRDLTFRFSTATEDLERFIVLLSKTAEHKFDTHGDRYYRIAFRTLLEHGAAGLAIAEHQGDLISSVMFFDSPTTRYYAHVGVDDGENRKVHASAPLVWTMIVDAKEKGLDVFDFWGVLEDDEPGHPWNGFSAFKKSFGGTLIQSSGTWDLPIHRMQYLMYKQVQRYRR